MERARESCGSQAALKCMNPTPKWGPRPLHAGGLFQLLQISIAALRDAELTLGPPQDGCSSASIPLASQRMVSRQYSLAYFSPSHQYMQRSLAVRYTCCAGEELWLPVFCTLASRRVHLQRYWAHDERAIVAQTTFNRARGRPHASFRMSGDKSKDTKASNA